MSIIEDYLDHPYTRLRVLITASRTWDDPWPIDKALDTAIGVAIKRRGALIVVHGGARGGDKLASYSVERAQRWGLPVLEEVHPAKRGDWARYNTYAGPRRNQGMVDLGADLCLAYIRDNSRGAGGCAAMAIDGGIPTLVIPWDTRHERILEVTAP